MKLEVVNLKQLTAKEVEQLLFNKEGMEIIDVREEFEYEVVHIPNVKHIPLSELDTRLNELNKNTPYIIVCRSGQRSFFVTQYLSQLGYDVTNMLGGMIEWEGPVETSD